MFPRLLRSAGRNGPEFPTKIYFLPSRTIDLTRTRRRQDAELERQGRRRLTFAQIRDERRDIGVGQSGVVAARHFRALREDVRKMAAPSRRIFARTQSLRLCGVQHQLGTRPRTREAVSGFSSQRGFKTAKTAAVSIWFIGRARRGSA